MSAPRKRDWSRRDFIRGGPRERADSTASGDASSTGEAGAGARADGDFTAPARGPDAPHWARNLELVLKEMDDLSGIENP